MNSELSDLALIDVPGQGPEDLSCTVDGSWVTGIEDGRIIQIDASGVAKALGNTGGRPVGLQVMADGSVIVADAMRGLLRLNLNGSIDVLANTFQGQPILFADDLDISADGVVWFTDASQRFSIHDFMLDLLEASRTGRLLSYDLNSGELTSHMEGLFFANGVALGPDERFVLVNETATVGSTVYGSRVTAEVRRISLSTNCPPWLITFHSMAVTLFGWLLPPQRGAGRSG